MFAAPKIHHAALRASQECRNYKRIIEIKERIEHNLGQTLIVNQLAKEFHLSPLELQEGFKQVVGSTVYRYIRQQRMKKASQLLQTTNFSITRIANEVGYDNPSKFTSAFKKIMFETPYEYRKKFQE
ncbi:helix-turn-helix transcriptional regulator [Bacillus chungangensis]|uniref:AraC-like DNA-binding protein n=1 Tax=Bacillus chungangensis TaxID=587633 RepID=A0ABT9WTM1_9BACI|nr:AraC family transcriptional regulator [Bacillus chungangensis]MDQ0176585.1 AraC-like DNA-binding protein [Bacillus chungangensis]